MKQFLAINLVLRAALAIPVLILAIVLFSPTFGLLRDTSATQPDVAPVVVNPASPEPAASAPIVVATPEPSPVATPALDTSAWDAFVPHVRAAAKEGRVLSRAVQKVGDGDPRGLRSAAKALRTWGHRELEWLNAYPPADCYERNHRTWSATVWGWIHTADDILDAVRPSEDGAATWVTKLWSNDELDLRDSFSKTDVAQLAMTDAACRTPVVTGYGPGESQSNDPTSPLYFDRNGNHHGPDGSYWYLAANQDAPSCPDGETIMAMEDRSLPPAARVGQENSVYYCRVWPTN